MNILAAQYGTELFGRERENIECYKSFIRLGHTIKVFGSYREKDGGHTGKLLEELGIKCGEMPFGSHFSLSYFRRMKGYWWLQLKRIYWCSRMMRTEAKKMKADAIFIGGTMEFLYLWPFLVFQKRPIIYRVGDAPIWESWFHKTVMKQLLRRATVVVPVSQFIHDQCSRLTSFTSSKAHTIWNIPPEFKNASKAKRNVTDSQPERLEEHSVKFVYVGQITPQKGVKTLINAFGLLANDLNWKCRIVGGGKHTQDFENQLRDLVKSRGLGEKIEFTGQVTNPEPHYEWANWHVLPSHLDEAFGLVIVEAKRQGLPSIVFPLGAMPELIDNNVNGIITKFDTPEALTTALEMAILSGPNMATAARASFEKDFTTLRFDADWKSVLHQL